MSVAVPPPPPGPAPGEFRILPIAANLLPTEVVESRRARHVRRVVVAALVLVAVLLGGWYAATYQETSGARSALGDAQATNTRLQHQQHQYDNLVSTQTQVQAMNKQMATLLANDLQWSQLVSKVLAAAPKGITVASITGGLVADKNGAPSAGTGSAATGTDGTPSGATPSGGTPSNAATRTVGTLDVTGTASGKQAVSAYLDAVAGLPGVSNVLLNTVSTKDNKLQFDLTGDLTGAILGGRYTSGATGSKGN